MDSVSLGPVAVHDHIAFDYHIPIKDDPCPHEIKEGYAFDGVDLAAAIHWHWSRARLFTQLRITPASRLHFAYDQDTDFEPTTASTHGNEGLAHSRTFAVEQTLPFWRLPAGWGALNYRVTLLRQWTRYHAVTTYDLNTNPALPSSYYQRLISERAIAYELRSTVALSGVRRTGPWRLRGELGLTPVTNIFLRNYIPVVLATTSAGAYGASTTLSAERRLGGWRFTVGGSAGVYQGYRWIEGFSRQEYTIGLDIAPPRFW